MACPCWSSCRPGRVWSLLPDPGIRILERVESGSVLGSVQSLSQALWPPDIGVGKIDRVTVGLRSSAGMRGNAWRRRTRPCPASLDWVGVEDDAAFDFNSLSSGSFVVHRLILFTIPFPERRKDLVHARWNGKDHQGCPNKPGHSENARENVRDQVPHVVRDYARKKPAVPPPKGTAGSEQPR
jgi:hypothetical protein